MFKHIIFPYFIFILIELDEQAAIALAEQRRFNPFTAFIYCAFAPVFIVINIILTAFVTRNFKT